MRNGGAESSSNGDVEQLRAANRQLTEENTVLKVENERLSGELQAVFLMLEEGVDEGEEEPSASDGNISTEIIQGMGDESNGFVSC